MSNIEKLSSSSSLKDLVDRQELLTNNIEEQKNTLKEILISKNIEVADSENKLSILIDKVDSELIWKDAHKFYLYRKSNEYTAVTGGWKVQEEANTGRVQKSSDYIRYYTISTNTADCGSHTRTTNLINITDYRKLHVLYEAKTTNSGMIEIQCYNSSNSRIGYAKQDLKTTSNLIDFSLDISNINTDVRVQVGMGISVGTPSNVDVKVYEIWLEK